MRTTTGIVLALGLTMSASSAKAHESNQEILKSGLICDTVEDVELAINRKPAKTCGMFRGELPVTVTLLHELIVGQITYRIARYDFAKMPSWGNPVQYGIWTKSAGTSL